MVFFGGVVVDFCGAAFVVERAEENLLAPESDLCLIEVAFRSPSYTFVF